MTHGTVYWTALFLAVPSAHGYSVLSHEAIIDSAWEQNIRPLLLKQFPQAQEVELVRAHAFAYGGCIIQDMGYYPFGNKFFSDLLHYVRTGDFVTNMIRDAQDLNEYAFALGSLAHYAADNDGHRIAVNPSVAIEYPKLQEKYGKGVTYADNPPAHLKVEFGFDALQVARGRYAPQSYHDFIGFQVSELLLERAFRDTYSLELQDVFNDVDLALGTYRLAVGRVVPEMTKVAWDLKKRELAQLPGGMTRRKFVYNLSRASFRREWSGPYKGSSIGTRILVFIFRILPKVGPLRAVGFKVPTGTTERLFEDSFDRTLDLYRMLLGEVGRGALRLENRNFDTGQPTHAAEYTLADGAYSKLAIKVAEKDPASLDPQVVSNILGYFRDPNLPYATRRHTREWKETLAALAKLRMEPAAPRTPASEIALPTK